MEASEYRRNFHLSSRAARSQFVVARGFCGDLAAQKRLGKMSHAQRIGVIGGNGWLGSALIRAAVDRGVVALEQLTVSSRSDNTGAINDLPVHWTHDNRELVQRSDIVILSVRPAEFDDVSIDLSNKLAVSVMAGVSCATISGKTNATRVVRAIPNAAAAIGQSFTPWFASPQVGARDKAVVQSFFEASGEAVEAPEESHIDYCVVLTGSGAAFPALLAEALIAEAVAQGLPRDFAIRAAKGVLCGASQLFHGSETDTAEIVREMIDYKGTTAAALLAMKENGFDQAVAAGLQAAAKKATMIASGS